MLQPNFSHLQNIDSRFLEPDASLVVMPQDVESALSDAHLALDGIASILEGAATPAADKSTRLIEVSPASLAALIRLINQQIKPATENPTLGAVRHLRPDLFNRNALGGL